MYKEKTTQIGPILRKINSGLYKMKFGNDAHDYDDDNIDQTPEK